MKNRIENICTILLLLLWIPVTLDKFMHYELFRNAMIQQPFSDQLGKVLAFTLPPLEAITAICLLRVNIRKIGYYLSIFLMSIFTGYIGYAVLGSIDNLPCGCGLVFHQLSWEMHFWMNLFFLVVSMIGLVLHTKKSLSSKHQFVRENPIKIQ